MSVGLFVLRADHEATHGKTQRFFFLKRRMPYPIDSLGKNRIIIKQRPALFEVSGLCFIFQLYKDAMITM